MAHGQIAFIFMNVVATFSSNAATVLGRDADRSARDLCSAQSSPALGP